MVDTGPGAALAKAAGKPLADLLKENISAPLGLTGTVSNQTAFIPEPVLHAFDGERGRYEESTNWDPSWTLAEGKVQTSTIVDLLKSAGAIGEGSLLTPESHHIQLAPATAAFPPLSKDNYYAYGHARSISPAPAATTHRSHPGSSPAGRSAEVAIGNVRTSTN